MVAGRDSNYGILVRTLPVLFQPQNSAFFETDTCCFEWDYITKSNRGSYEDGVCLVVASL